MKTQYINIIKNQNKEYTLEDFATKQITTEYTDKYILVDSTTGKELGKGNNFYDLVDNYKSLFSRKLKSVAFKSSKEPVIVFLA